MELDITNQVININPLINTFSKTNNQLWVNNKELVVTVSIANRIYKFGLAA